MALSALVCTPVLTKEFAAYSVYDSETLSPLTFSAVFVQPFSTSYTVYHRHFLPLAKVLLFLLLLCIFLMLRSQFHVIHCFSFVEITQCSSQSTDIYTQSFMFLGKCVCFQPLTSCESVCKQYMFIC